MQYFALSVYEEWIATKWKIVPDARKAELIAFLLDLGIQHGKVWISLNYSILRLKSFISDFISDLFYLILFLL